MSVTLHYWVKQREYYWADILLIHNIFLLPLLSSFSLSYSKSPLISSYLLSSKAPRPFHLDKLFILTLSHPRASPITQLVKKKKKSACNMGDLGSILGLGRSPREGNGYPLQYSGLEHSMDYTVHVVSESRTLSSFLKVSNLHFHFFSP